MDFRRALRHVLFWIVFFCASLFHELYFSSSFSADPSWDFFFKACLAQALIYIVKMGVVYFSIYYIIPKWSGRQDRTSTPFLRSGYPNTKYLYAFILVLLVGALCIRLIVQNIIWIHVFGGEERVLSFSSTIARYIYSLFDLIPIALVAVGIKLVQLRVLTLKEETRLIQEKLKSELLYLKAQTNPHFLFNTLNGIYALSRKNDSHTPQAIMSLSRILRYMLYETSHRTNALQDELRLIAEYIDLQKLRFQEHLTVSFTQDLDESSSKISPLLLLPLVENAFKHSYGLDTHIDISVLLRDEVLTFTITNNLSEEMADDSLSQDGIGLKNIKRQLAILYKEYSFEAGKTETQFVARLIIHLNTFVDV